MSKNVAFSVVFLLATCWVVASMPGGWSDAQVDDKDVRDAAMHATRVLSERFNSKYHHALKKVTRAEQQVVAGMNYRLELVVGMTTCKKGEVEFEDAENCDFQDSKSTFKKCTVVVYRSLKGYHRLVRSGCSLISSSDL